MSLLEIETLHDHFNLFFFNSLFDKISPIKKGWSWGGRSGSTLHLQEAFYTYLVGVSKSMIKPQENDIHKIRGLGQGNNQV